MVLLYQPRRLMRRDGDDFKAALKIVNNRNHSSSKKMPPVLETLPGEVLLEITTYLDFSDQCCLFLTNKFFAVVLLTSEFSYASISRNHLAIPSPSSRDSLIYDSKQQAYNDACQYNILLQRLEGNWMPVGLKLCQLCWTFQPTDANYWTEKEVELVNEDCEDCDGDCDLCLLEQGSLQRNSAPWALKVKKHIQRWIERGSRVCPWCIGTDEESDANRGIVGPTFEAEISEWKITL